MGLVGLVAVGGARAEALSVLSVTTLPEVYGGGNGAVSIDLSRCSAGVPIPGTYRYDCTDLFNALVGMPMKETVAISPEFRCQIARILTVTRADALANAVAVGFYSFGGGEGREISLAAIPSVGSAILKDGSPGIVHAFAGLTRCWKGTVSSTAVSRYRFKPYLKSARGDGFTYDWDSVPEDYELNFSVGSFDRSSELITQ